MRWVTRDFLHFDRVACAWLIKRFIDPAATFTFVPWGSEHTRAPDAIPFSIPGTALGPHDAHGATFSKILAEYELPDPTLAELSRIIDAGVAYALHRTSPQPDDECGLLSLGLLAVCEGLQLLHSSDDDIVDAALPIYDALYAQRRAHGLVEAGNERIPEQEGRGPTYPTQFLRRLLATHGVFSHSRAGGSNGV
ncbi:chromate resistance protein ChrB domain-containing protein [Candidimonas nitroreducens]|uniref:Chromate resistance protein n=1 Tax=Candidimonas nitroreducens TaxID=683354 RepID=A0A225MJQ6_9BURK|nr:chromate resistance protein ChrB domain-containing protein [Candidimonas nitroreducens]OWT60140.1 chromate resistance protein [Candidimonas nitroreducens]